MGRIAKGAREGSNRLDPVSRSPTADGLCAERGESEPPRSTCLPRRVPSHQSRQSGVGIPEDVDYRIEPRRADIRTALFKNFLTDHQRGRDLLKDFMSEG